MVIKILHRDRELHGKVLFNFRKLSNVILVQFDKPLEGTNRDVLIYKDKSGCKWHDTENIEYRFPQVYEQIIYKLRNVFREATTFSEQD